MCVCECVRECVCVCACVRERKCEKALLQNGYRVIASPALKVENFKQL